MAVPICTLTAAIRFVERTYTCVGGPADQKAAGRQGAHAHQRRHHMAADISTPGLDVR